MPQLIVKSIVILLMSITLQSYALLFCREQLSRFLRNQMSSVSPEESIARYK